MKKIFKYILIFAGVSALTAACTRNFEEMNTDPFGADEEELSRDAYNVRC